MSNKVKRELEKIDIPDELHDRAKSGVKKAKTETRRSKQAAGRPRFYKRLILVATVFLMIGSALSFTPALATVQQIYDQIFSSQHIDDTGVRMALKSGEGQILDQTYYDKKHDITVHFDRVLTDGKETKLLLTYQSDKTDLQNYYIDLFEGVSSINLIVGNEQKRLDNVGWGSRYYNSEKNKVAEALSFDSIKNHEGQQISLEVEDLTIWRDGDGGEAQTTWPVEFKLKQSAISERESVTINKEFTFKDETYKIKHVEFSEMETRVVVTGSDIKAWTENGTKVRMMSKLEKQFLNPRENSKEYGYRADVEKSGVYLKSSGEKVDPIYSKGEVEGADNQFVMTFAPVKDRQKYILEVGEDIEIPLTK
ncbi:hypothetical protein GCM10008983_18710 [Lentibacillus halophilus]|uniref:DUF4179 domain-containing protein n=1 Tax=Lentibacillus halophilus TaxID=295065 RepID=A0ABN0ZBI1_9BACI